MYNRVSRPASCCNDCVAWLALPWWVYCRGCRVGKSSSSETEGSPDPGSNPEMTNFLTDNCEQATDAIMHLFTKQYKLASDGILLTGGEAVYVL